MREFNVEFAIDGSIPDEKDFTSGQQHKPSISKVTESLCRARETPTAGETAKCAGHTRGEDASTKGSAGRSRSEATATSKHVGTTLRKNEGFVRGVADGQGSEEHTHKTFHKASRWGYRATGKSVPDNSAG